MGVFILQVKFNFFDFMGIDCQTVNKTHINIRSNYPKHPSSPTLLYLKIIQFQKVNCTLSSLHVKWIGDFVVSADHKIRKLRDQHKIWLIVNKSGRIDFNFVFNSI